MLRSRGWERLEEAGGREKGLLGLLGVVAVAIGFWFLRHSGAAPAVLGRPPAERPLPAVARIDLARLDAPRGENDAGRRDLFAFGHARDWRCREPSSDVEDPRASAQ